MQDTAKASDATGSRKVCDEWAIMSLGLAVIYFLFNCGPMFI
jgi:hypothetical protein